MKMNKILFGECEQGPVQLFQIQNSNGMKVELSEYGAAIKSLSVPDRKGELVDVVLGYDTLDEYMADDCFMGVIVGRFANRIAKGSFELEGTSYSLAINDPPNHLHGGPAGYAKKIWSAKEIKNGVAFSLTSPHGEEGYPGNLTICVEYTLTEDNQLMIDLKATTDKATHVNLAQHSYFNLQGSGDILHHQLQLHAPQYCPVDDSFIPLKEIQHVAGSAFDFTAPVSISDKLDFSDPQILKCKGFDHNFIVTGKPDALKQVASLSNPANGISLSILSTQPGVQLYTGNYLNDIHGKSGQVYQPHSGLCLETQHYPDTPNRADFPSSLVTPDRPYHERMEYHFNS